MEPRIHPWKRKIIFQTIIFRFTNLWNELSRVNFHGWIFETHFLGMFISIADTTNIFITGVETSTPTTNPDGSAGTPTVTITTTITAFNGVMLILSFLSISMVLEFGNTAGRPSSWTMLGRARVNPCETQPGRRPRVGYAPARHLPVRRLCQNISISCWLCLNVLEALFCCDLNGSFGLEVWSDARVGSYGCFFQDNLLGVPTNHGNWGRWRFDIAVTPFVENTGGAMARSRVDRNPGASSQDTYRGLSAPDQVWISPELVQLCRGDGRPRGVQKNPATPELSFFGWKKW